MASNRPFDVKTPANYIISELNARKNPTSLSRLRPWVSVTSNLSPGKTLSTTSYTDVFGKNGMYVENGSPNYVSNPLVTEWSIDFSARGTLRKGTMKIKCFSISQLEELQKYFMEPGISVFVQWGWNHSASTGKSVFPKDLSVDTQRKYFRNYDSLYQARNAANGCYDNMLGIITKAESSVTGTEFTITCKISSVGELLSGLQPGDSGIPKPENNTDEDGASYGWFRIQNMRGGNNPGLMNWAYFFNQLPTEFRKESIKKWGEKKGSGINPCTDFLMFDEVWLDDVRSETGDQGVIWTSNEFKFYGKKFFTQTDANPISQKKYVKFSAFVALWNRCADYVQAVQTDNKKSPMLFRIRIDDTYCGAFKRIFSCNESVFIPNKGSSNWYNEDSFYKAAKPAGDLPVDSRTGKGPESIFNAVKGADGTIVSFPAVGKTPKYKDYTYGWIGDLYIDNDLVTEALKNFNRPIKDTWDSILDTMSEASAGLWRFQMHEESDDKQNWLQISDSNLLNTNEKPTPIVLDYMGPNSVFLEGSFNFDIPKGMANQIVMSRTVPKTQSTQPGLKGLFSSQKDMVVTEEFLKSCFPPDPNPAPPGATEEEKEEELWKAFVNDARILINPTISELAWSATVGADISDYLLAGASKNVELFQKFQRGNVVTGNTSSSGPLPIKVNFTILGMSGFKFGDLVKINGLPKQYSKAETGAFMITEVKHKVDNKLWTTECEAMFRPYIVI